MRIPVVEKIWRTSGAVTVSEPLGRDEAFGRLAPLLDDERTELALEGDTLSFVKSNPAAQDRLATFNRGELRYERGAEGTSLHFDLASPALVLTFLAPVLFFLLGQAFIGLGLLEETLGGDRRAVAEEESEEDEKEPRELHWIDQMLGAPAPESPEEEDDTGEGEDEEEEDDTYSPTASYVFAGIFAVIYLVGRVLEPFLLRRTLRRALAGEIAPAPQAQEPSPGDTPGAS